jgi:reactive intermediate/imine deaminase
MSRTQREILRVECRHRHRYWTLEPHAEEILLKFINSDAAKAANLPFSQIARVGKVLYVSGALGNVDGKFELVPGGIEAETQKMMENIGATLALAGAGYGDIFKCVVYLADIKEWGAFNTVYQRHFEAGKFPARTAVGVNELIMGARVEMECWANVARKKKNAKAKAKKARKTKARRKAARKAKRARPAAGTPQA